LDKTRSLEDRLWASADVLRNNLDPAEYKHLVLGLLVLRSVDTRPDWHGTNGGAWAAIVAQTNAPDLAVTLDSAIVALGLRVPDLSSALSPRFVQAGLPAPALASLVHLINTIPLQSGKEREVDLLGRVYEYFLGRFASSEGRGGGEYYTPASVVQLLVDLLEPYGGVVYDPCCGSGGMFVQSVQFVQAHGGVPQAVLGQESNTTTWRMAKMNLLLRGIEADLGPGPADTLAHDVHPALKADFVLANPPFNVSRWVRNEADPRWVYGLPPATNANFAWLQHILYHLAPGGLAAVVLANGSLTTQTGGEGAIRARLVQAGVVAAVIALPDQLFYSTPIPACVWILAKDRADVAGRTLMIDARQLGRREDRTHRVLDPNDRAAIVAAWREHRNGNPVHLPGFAQTVAAGDVDAGSLAPGGYVGPPPAAPTSALQAAELAQAWRQAHEEGARLDARIAATLARIGW
jgi:type I restriction enzyme M protein